MVQPFISKKLEGGGRLMVIFDVPEEHADRRRKFRSILRQLKFVQIQQSVWMSENDYREVLFESIQELHLHDWVELYEAALILKNS